LYQYSDDPRDMTNCVNYDEALTQYSYIVEQVARLMKPGRISAVHCTDLKRGSIYQHDFPGDIIRIHDQHGMKFFCRITIWREAWEFARRTRMKTLMHKTIVQDSSTSRIAPADYVLVFLKSGVNTVPITHASGFRHYAGGKLIPAKLRDYLSYRGDQKGNSLSHWIYRQYASPIWMDIRRGRLLPFHESKENPEERHVCPLQIDTVERCLSLWSNPGEIVLTPFLGIGTEAWVSVRNGRKAIGAELKSSYYRQALANMAMVDRPEDDDLKFGMGNDSLDGTDNEDDSDQESMAFADMEPAGITEDEDD
jgi:DNA methylase